MRKTIKMLDLNEEYDDLDPQMRAEVGAWLAGQTASRYGEECTHCERETGVLIPWARERLCLDCMDTQLDLVARAMRELPVQVGKGVTTPGHVTVIDWVEAARMALTRTGEIDCWYMAGHLTPREHQELLLLAAELPRTVKEI